MVKIRGRIWTIQSPLREESQALSQTTRALVLIFALLSAIPGARGQDASPARVELFEGVRHLLVLRFLEEAE